MKHHLSFYFATAAAVFAISATAAFGQAQAPKTNRQPLQKPAIVQQHELRREKQRNLFLPLKQGNVKTLRASQATALLLDSVVVQENPAAEVDNENFKIAYSYNAAGNRILEVTYDRDESTQTWKEADRSGYDDNGNLILDIYTYISAYWDEETQQYIESEVRQKDEYAYDRLNWRTLSASYEWENGQWKGSYKYVYEYTDRADSYTERNTNFQWGNGEWQADYGNEYTYSGRRSAGGDDYNSDSNDDLPPLPEGQKTGSDNLLDEAHYSYDNGNNVYGNKTEYAKDADGNVILETYYSWNQETQAWEESSRQKIEYAYNADGLLTAATYYYWNYATGDWALEPSSSSYTVTYAFDTNNNVLSFTKQTSDGQIRQKVDYADYDAQRRALKAIQYNWREYYDEEVQAYRRKWTKEYSYERAFDSYGNRTLYDYSSFWNDVLNYRYRNEYEYDATGRQTMYSSIGDYGSDIFGDKYETAFDANGNETLNIRYQYDSATQAFVPEYKYEYTYGDRIAPDTYLFDSNYIPLTMKNSEWDSELNSWVVSMDGKYEWQFDDANNPTTVTIDIKIDNEWIWYGTATFYYSSHNVSGIAGIPSSDRSVWISESRLHVENGVAGAVQLFDISGRRQLSVYSSGGQTFDVSYLPQGVYLVQVNGKTFKVVKK
ncbi:MAG: T9SS type A sorting domain-containing protein [Dysgonamonadaceae bacterium]|jgi:YD repeat-containing protein|nr:T9SS type A sorting domain-containing protein [Dysgonamonadaceae bacterium]